MLFLHYFSMILNQNNLKNFWYYISERHSIYKKSKLLKLDPQWTNDPILQKYKFTNVFRDLDPGTKYVIEKIIPKSINSADIIFNIVIYRLYNKIGTFEFVGFQFVKDFDVKVFESKLRELKSKNIPVFTNAFLVSGYSFVDGKDKIEKTCKIINGINKSINKITESIIFKNDSKFTFESIKSLKGIGDFLAYQICVDIGYWNKSIFNEDKFVIAGPGCKSGINRLFIDHSSLSYEDCIRCLCELQFEGFKSINVNINELFSDRKDKFLNIMAMENCLCEISKYLKVYYNEGRPRNKYLAR